jgi:hypothetical protein
MELMINHFLFINAPQSGSLVVFFQFLDHLQWCSVCDVTLQKYFSHPCLVIYFFATPLIKRKLGQQIDVGLLIANHLDQSL